MQEQPRSRGCFLCGLENKKGFQLTWFSDYGQNQVWTELEVEPFYNGYPGVVHGGIVAALLDETSFRAIALEEKENFLISRLFVTATLNIQYRRPTPTGQTLRVVGWIKRMAHNSYETLAEIRLQDGTVTASCRALIMQPSEDFAQETSFASDWVIDQ